MQTPSPPATGAMRLTLALCFLAAMCEGFDVQSAGVAAAGLSHSLRTTPAQLGVVFSAANLGLLFGAAIGGRLADRIGRKPVLTASLAAFGLFSLLTAAAGNLTLLTLARLATGVGLGGAMPNMIALAAGASGGRVRNATIGLTYVGMPVGGVAASLMAVGLAPGSWRLLFVAGGVAPLLVGVLMAVALREVREPGPDAPSGASAPLSAIFGAGRLRRTLGLWLGVFAAALTLHLMLNWLPLLMQGRGLGKADATLAQVAFNLIGAATALAAAAGLDGRARGLSLALSVAATPVALLALSQAPAALALMAAGAGLLGAGVFALHIILYGAAGEAYPESVRGTALGAMVGAGRLGALCGPALAAVLLGAGRSPAEVLASVLPVALAAGGCAAWVAWPRRRAVALAGAT